MHKDPKDRSERSQTKMAALGRDNERLNPSVLTVLAQISERGYQTFFIRSITAKIEMTCISRTENAHRDQEQDLFFPTSTCNPFLR